MNIPKGLTASQKHNLSALIIGGLATLNEHWPQVTALVGQHYHGLPVPPAVTLALQIAALCITAASRALNRAKSGTGTGLVGEAPKPVFTPSADEAPASVFIPTVFPAPADYSPAMSGQFVSASNDLLTLALNSLPAVAKQEVRAFAAQKMADAEAEVVKNLTGMSGYKPGELASAIPAPSSPHNMPPAASGLPSAGALQGSSGVIVAPDPNAVQEGDARPPVVVKNPDGSLSVAP